MEITYNGETHTIREWSKIVGLKENTLGNRLLHGWSVEDALTTPAGVVAGGHKIIPCTGCRYWKPLQGGVDKAGLYCCDYANSHYVDGLPGTRGKVVDGKLVFPPVGRLCPHWTEKPGG